MKLYVMIAVLSLIGILLCIGGMAEVFSQWLGITGPTPVNLGAMVLGVLFLSFASQGIIYKGVVTLK